MLWAVFHLGGTQTLPTLEIAIWHIRFHTKTTHKQKKKCKKYFISTTSAFFYALKNLTLIPVTRDFTWTLAFWFGMAWYPSPAKKKYSVIKQCAENQLFIFLSTDESIRQHPLVLGEQKGKVHLAAQTSRQTTDDTSDCHIRMERLCRSKLK